MSKFIADYRQHIQNILEQYLPLLTEVPFKLDKAMRYALLNGGKRWRPLLVYAIGTALGASRAQLDIPACAVECIHTYSLIHDDLPAMDNDDLRRGKPTCHKAFDEATAILAGDALNTYAFELIATAPSSLLTDAQKVSMIAQLTSASGPRGMVGGQMLDLEATQQISVHAAQEIHRLKTAALIQASVMLGCSAASKTTKTHVIEALNVYGQVLGLAFQIRDDILDVEGEVAILGKQPGGDAQRNKWTYVTSVGLDQAKADLVQLKQKATEVLNSLSAHYDMQICRELTEVMLAL